MDEAFLDRLIALTEGSRVAVLDYSEGGTRVRIVRGSEGPPGTGITEQPSIGLAPDHPGRETTPAARPAATPPVSSEHIVAAGTYGVFYRAPAPGQPPFVSEGDLVEEGQTLALFEAMKMLTPLEADCAGRITGILVADGTSVEVGMPLFTMTLSPVTSAG